MPARNAAATIEAAVASIRRQPEVDDIVVALGPSDDDTGRVLAELGAHDPGLIVVENPDGRIPTALNRAWGATRGQVLVRVDAHSLLPEGYVADALQELRSSGAANVGGVQRPVAHGGFRAAVAAAMACSAGSGGATYRSGGPARDADTVFLGVYRREALEAVGGYDERFDRNEDTELNIRLRAAGFRVWFTPRLSVDYLPRGDVGSLARQYFANGRWRRLTSQVHPTSTRARQILPAALVAGSAGSVLLAGWRRRFWPLMPLLVYPAVLVGAAKRCSGASVRTRDVVVALATMHLSFGAGFLVGPPGRARWGMEGPPRV